MLSDQHYRSQIGQDKWVIEDVFHEKRNGFFLDVGALDGVLLSNTYVLEKDYGWNGICIEASSAFARLKMNRRCICENTCIADTEKTVHFTEKGWDSGISTEASPASRPMRTETLAAVLERHAAPHVIDYCSIDIEGGEYDALRVFPFHTYSFLCLTVEQKEREIREALQRLLTSNGYVLSLSPGIEDWYLHESIAQQVRYDGTVYAERFYRLWHSRWDEQQKTAQLTRERNILADRLAKMIAIFKQSGLADKV